MLMTYRELRVKVQRVQGVCEGLLMVMDCLDKLDYTPQVEEQMFEELKQSLVDLQAAMKEVETWKHIPTEHMVPVLV